MGELFEFLFGDDEEEPKKSGRATKPGPGGGRKPPPKKSGRPGKSSRKTVAGGSGTHNKRGAKSAPVKTKKGSDPMPSKDDLRKKYIKKAEGDADDVQFHIELYGEFMMQDPPKVDAATALYKGAPPAAKKAIDRLYRSADEVSAAAATKSGKGKTPAGMNKADYDAAKAKAEQLKADGKDRGEATFELATLNVDPDIINAVITEVYV